MKKNSQSKAHDFRRKLTPRFESKEERGQPYAKFLCKDVSLPGVLKKAAALVLNESESDAACEQALLVQQAIENALPVLTERDTRLFNAGMRWLNIFWVKSLKGRGANVGDKWKKAEQFFRANPKITAGQLWIKCGRPGDCDSFKRTLSRKRKVW